MSLHLFRESTMSDKTSLVDNNVTPGDESSDSDSASSSSVASRLRNELEMERKELARLKKNIKDLTAQLRLVEDENSSLEQDREDKSKALHRATSKIKELLALCDERNDEIDDLKGSLEKSQGRERRLQCDLGVSDKKCCLLDLEKSQLEERITQMEEDARRMKQNAIGAEQLLAELDQLRTNNLVLRRELVAAKESGRHIFENIVGKDDSPDRTVFDAFEWRTDGVNLNRELSMLDRPFIASPARSIQTQTYEIPVARSSFSSPEAEAMTCRIAVPITFASVQTDCGNCIRTTAVSAGTQTSHLDSGNTSGGTRDFVLYQPGTYSTPNLTQPNYVGTLRSNRIFVWIWLTAFFCLIFSVLNKGVRINITPIVDSFRPKCHHQGIPPH